MHPGTRDWRYSAILAAALGLFASPDAFAGPDDAPPLKPAIAGFIDMQDISWHNENDGQPMFTLDNVRRFPGDFGGIVLNATWNEMQPTRDGALVTERIDGALDQVRKYNAAHPSGQLGVKLRIYQGNQAPLWAKKIGGKPLTIQRNPKGCHTPDHNCPITIGRVWDSRYIAHWRRFQRAVAAIYDSEPLIRSVAITSCAMETDEPFVMPVVPPPPEGYSDAADQACLRGAVNDYAAWRSTPIDYTINAFMNLPGPGTDPGFSRSVMNQCRAKLGPQCELGNHAFSATMPEENAAIVAAIARRGAPIHYQTVGPNVKGFDWEATVRRARTRNATGLELWPAATLNGFMSLSKRRMDKLSALFNGQD